MLLLGTHHSRWNRETQNVRRRTPGPICHGARKSPEPRCELRNRANNVGDRLQFTPEVARFGESDDVAVTAPALRAKWHANALPNPQIVCEFTGNRVIEEVIELWQRGIEQHVGDGPPLGALGRAHECLHPGCGAQELDPGRRLPRELGQLPAEVAVGARLRIDRAQQLEISNDRRGAQVEHLAYRRLDALKGHRLGAERLDIQPDGVRPTDRVGDLQLGAASETCCDHVLRNPAHGVCGRTVDLRRVFAAERAAAVAARAAVGVDDDLASGQTGVAHWPADDEGACRVDEELSLTADEFGALEHRPNDLALDVGVQLGLRDLPFVLRGEHDGLDADGAVVIEAVRATRRKSWLTEIIDTLTMFPYIIPGSVLGITLLLAFNDEPLLLSGTAFIIIISLVIRRLPYTLRSSSAILYQISPSLEEASISLGASPLRTFFKVTAVMMLPGVMSGAILSWITAINELSSSVILFTGATKTMSVAIYTEVIRASYGTAAALSTILTVTTITAMVIFFKVSGTKDVTL